MYPAIAPVTGPVRALPAAQLRALGTVLARAFAPPWWPAAALPVLSLGFSVVLLVSQCRGVVMYLPCRAVAVLTRPQSRPWLVGSRLARLGRTHWCVSNCAAWPTGKEAGTALVAGIVELADRSGADLCLRASGDRSREFYRRAGFLSASPDYDSMIMARQRQPIRPLSAPIAYGPVLLAGRLAASWPPDESRPAG